MRDLIATARVLRFTPREARPDGPVAQWLEPAAHNGLVAGSSPARPTSQIFDITWFSVSTYPRLAGRKCKSPHQRLEIAASGVDSHARSPGVENFFRAPIQQLLRLRQDGAAEDFPFSWRG